MLIMKWGMRAIYIAFHHLRSAHVFRLTCIASLVIASALSPFGRCCCASESKAARPAAPCCLKVACSQGSPARQHHHHHDRCPCEKWRPMAIGKCCSPNDSLSGASFRFEFTSEPILSLAIGASFGEAHPAFPVPAALYGREMLRAYQTLRC